MKFLDQAKQSLALARPVVEKHEIRMAIENHKDLLATQQLELIKKLAAFPNVAEGAARAHEPHRLAFYLYDLAAAFHTQWTKGNESPHLRFIQAHDGTLTAARLALIRANAQVLAAGLAIIGVHAPDEMR